MKQLYKCRYCNTLSYSKKKLLEHEKNCPNKRLYNYQLKFNKIMNTGLYKGSVNSPLESAKLKNGWAKKVSYNNILEDLENASKFGDKKFKIL